VQEFPILSVSEAFVDEVVARYPLLRLPGLPEFICGDFWGILFSVVLIQFLVLCEKGQCHRGRGDALKLACPGGSFATNPSASLS